MDDDIWRSVSGMEGISRDSALGLDSSGNLAIKPLAWLIYGGITMKTPSITTVQFFILTFGLTLGTSILVTPSGLAGIAREDAWIADLLSTAINLFMVCIYIVLARLYPGSNLFEIFENILGKWCGKVLSLLYLFYILILTGTLLGNLGFFLTSEMMPETPIEATQILFLIAAVVCARLGIVVLARVGELVFPFIIVLFLVLVLTLIPQIHLDFILPIFDDGIAPIIKAGSHAAVFQELIIMMVFIPLVQEKKKGERAFLGGALLGELFLTLIVLLSVLVLGIEQTENNSFPAYALAKTINVGNFLQRVEGILVMIWILTFFIKISLLFFSMLKGMRVVFGLKEEGALINTFSVLIILVAWETYINSVYVGEIIQKVWFSYALLHLIVVPFLLCLTGLIKRKLLRK